MKIFVSKWLNTVAATLMVAMLFSCNKDLPKAEPIVTTPGSGSTIFETIRANGATYSYLDSAIVRASGFNNPAGRLDALLNDKNAVFTFFAPDNDAFQRSFQALGLPTGVLPKGFRAGQLDSILRYHMVGGQEFNASSVPTTFPYSLYLQSSLVLAAPSATSPPGYRMPIFPGKQGAISFANNIPLVGPEIEAANGIFHRATFILFPPSQVLWQRIAADPDLEYLEAAVLKADGNSPTPGTLQSALLNPAANFTLFAPSNAAFQQLLTGQITLALMGMGLDAATAAAQAAALASTPAVFTNPALAGVLTPQSVAGLVVYHLLTKQNGEGGFDGVRAFSVNIPSDNAVSSPTLLNGVNPAYANHPGVTFKSTYGFSGVIAIAVKGVGNGTASNVQINPTPAPGGTSDQHYINGTLHKIDQVLLPQ